jgi:hypothetical protein
LQNSNSQYEMSSLSSVLAQFRCGPGRGFCDHHVAMWWLGLWRTGFDSRLDD